MKSKKLNIDVTWGRLKDSERRMAIETYLKTATREEKQEAFSCLKLSKKTMKYKVPKQVDYILMALRGGHFDFEKKEILFFYYTIAKKDILVSFLDALGVDHNSGEVEDFSKIEKLNESEIESAGNALRDKGYSSDEMGMLFNTLYCNSHSWKILENKIHILLNSAASDDDSSKKKRVKEKIEEEKKEAPADTSFTKMDGVILRLIGDVSNGTCDNVNEEDLDEIVNEFITISSAEKLQYRYYHLGLMHSVFSKPENVNSKNDSAKDFYRLGYYSGLIKERKWEPIINSFMASKDETKRFSRFISYGAIGFEVVSKMFELLIEYDKSKIAALLLNAHSYNRLTPFNEEFIGIVNNTIKQLLLREETSSANNLIRVLDGVVKEDNLSLREQDITRVLYFKARFLQLIGNFEKSMEIYESLIKPNSEWNYVHYTNKALCRLYQKDVKYIHYPDNQTDVVNLFMKLDEEKDLFLKAVECNPEKAVNARWALAIIYLAGGQKKEAVDTFRKLIYKVEKYYADEYKELNLEKTLYFYAAVAEAETYDIRQMPKVEDLLNRIVSSRAAFSFSLWKRLIGAVENVNSPQYIKSIFRIISKSRMPNKKRILSMFTSEHLYEEEEFIEIEYHKILAIKDTFEVICKLYEFIDRFAEFNFYRCENAISEIKTIVDSDADESIIKSAINLAKRYDNVLGVLYSDNKVKKYEFLIHLHELLSDDPTRKELEQTIENCIECCYDNYETLKLASYLELLQEEFPNNKNLASFKERSGVKDDGNETLIEGYNYEIKIAFFGGNEAHRNAVKRVKNELTGKYTKKVSLEYESCYIGNSSNWGRKLDTYKKIIDKADIVIIHRDIRTGLGGHLREMAEDKWFACSFKGKGAILKKIEYACAFYIKNISYWNLEEAA